MHVKDAVEVIAAIVAVGGGLIAAFKAVREMREQKEQNARDLRWKRAREAMELLNQLNTNSLVKAATLMLDWSEREFALPSGKRAKITKQAMLRALRTENLDFTEEEVFIRDVFDSFFAFLERVELATKISLVEFDDIKGSIGYLAEKMSKNRGVFSKFISSYGYNRAEELLALYPEWRGADRSQ